MVFPVVMYGYENWSINKAEHQRTDVFELRCWRRLLRVFWTARKSNQSILKEFSPGCSLEELMLKLKLQYFCHWCEELTREGDNRWWWLEGFTSSVDMGLGRLWKLVMDRKAWRTVVHGVTKSGTWLSDWTELKWEVTELFQAWNTIYILLFQKYFSSFSEDVKRTTTTGNNWYNCSL